MRIGKSVEKSIRKGVAVVVASLLCFNSGVSTLSVSAAEMVETVQEESEVIEAVSEEVEVMQAETSEAETETVTETAETAQDETEEAPEVQKEAETEAVPEALVEALETDDIIETVISNPYAGDNEQAFAEYVDHLFYEDMAATQTQQLFGENEFAGIANGVSTFASADTGKSLLYNQLGDELEKQIYIVLCDRIKKIASGEADSSEIEMTFSTNQSQDCDGIFTSSKMTFEELGVTDKEEAKKAISAITSPDLKKVHEAILYDMPYELYWYDKVAGATMGTANTYSIYTNKTTGMNSIAVTSMKVVMRFSVSTDFCKGEQTVVGSRNFYFSLDTEKTGAATEAVTEAKKVVSEAAGKNDYEKICYYRDYILGEVSYNSQAIYFNEDYGNPWQLIWVFDRDYTTNVVCEGYSKAFKYLCDLSDFEDENISCLLMGGKLKGEGWSVGEGHMWNIIRMDDEKNYLVDLTNSDFGTSGYGGDLFLNGYDAKGDDISENIISSKVEPTYYEYNAGYSKLRYYAYISLDESYGMVSDLTDCDYDKEIKSVEINGTYQYSGEEIIPDITVYSYSGEIIGEDNYTVCIKNNINACDKDAEEAPEISVKAKEGYYGQANTTFTIDYLKITGAEATCYIIKEKNADGYYEFWPRLKYQDKELVFDVDYTYGLYKADQAGNSMGEALEYANENGRYLITVSGKGNYKDAINYSVEVDDLIKSVKTEDIPEEGIPEGMWIAGLEEHYAYTGAAIRPKISVYDGNRALTGKDYIISYSANIKAGIAKITIKGIGSYCAEISYNFIIDPVDLSDESVQSSVYELYKTGTVHKPVPKLIWNGQALQNKEQYTISYYLADDEGNPVGDKLTGVVEAGNYVAVLEGIGNFTGTRNVQIVVHEEKKPINMLSFSGIVSQKYSDEGAKLPLIIKDGKYTLEEGTDYSTYYPVQPGAGAARVIVSGMGRYTGTKTINFIIKGTSVKTLKITGLPARAVYSGVSKEFDSIVIRDNSADKILTEDVDYRLEWQKNVDAGTAAVVVTGLKGYTGSVKKTFKITPDKITENSDNIGVYLKQSSIVFSKNGARPDAVVIYSCEDGNRKILKEGIDYTIAYKNNKSVNSTLTPVAEIIFKGNYSGTVKKTFSITSKDIGALSVEAKDKILVKGRIKSYKTSLVVRDEDNYALTAGKDYERNYIYSYMEDVTVINKGESVLRTAGTVIEGDCEYDIIPANTKIAVKVTATENGNYTGTATGYFHVAEKNIKAVSAKVKSKEYTGNAIYLSSDDIELKYGKNEVLKPGIDYEIVEGSYVNNTKKGRAKVTIRGIGSYGGTKTITFTISARSID